MEQLGADHISIKIVQKRLYHAHLGVLRHELLLSDDAITVLTSGNFNHRLLSEMICHKDFQRMMLDAEIYVDRIADMQITNMNAAMEAVRQSVIKKKETIRRTCICAHWNWRRCRKMNTLVM